MLTYSDLRTKILSYLDYYDEEIEREVNSFIDLAEKEIGRILRIPSYEKIVELPFDEMRNRDMLKVPNDYIETKDMFINETSEPVKMSSFAFIMRKRAGIDKSTEGSGRYYARVGNNFIIYPEVEEKQTVLLNYYADPVNMRDDTDSNYILTIAPDLILYLSMKHAHVFLKNEEEEAKYNALASNALEQIRQQVERMDTKPAQKVVPRRF